MASDSVVEHEEMSLNFSPVFLRDELSGKCLELFRDADGDLVFKAEAGEIANRVAVISLPKAGTYLVARLLSLLGYVDSEIHTHKIFLDDYRGKTIELKRKDYLQFGVHLPLRYTVGLIKSGQFLVGHLPSDEEIGRCLHGFKKVFVYRNLRDALVSHMRFFAATGRGGPTTQLWKDLPDGPQKLLQYLEFNGPMLFSMFEEMIGWYDQAETFRISFENLYGDDAECGTEAQIHKLGNYLDLKLAPDIVNDAAGKLFGAETLTWSGQRSNANTFWDDAVEARFIGLGGYSMNQRLGYD